MGFERTEEFVCIVIHIIHTLGDLSIMLSLGAGLECEGGGKGAVGRERRDC